MSGEGVARDLFNDEGIARQVNAFFLCNQANLATLVRCDLHTVMIDRGCRLSVDDNARQLRLAVFASCSKPFGLGTSGPFYILSLVSRSQLNSTKSRRIVLLPPDVL